jgi:hypothetical protein
MKAIKHTYKYSLFFLIVSGLVLGCFPNEDELTHPYWTDTDIPVITDVESPIFNFLDMDNAFVEFTVDVNPEIIQSLTVEQLYGGRRATIATYNTFPAQVRIPLSDALGGIPGVSQGDLGLGDVFTYELVVTSHRGAVSRSNAIVRAPVACPSDLGGTYSYSTIVTAVGAGGNLGACPRPVTGTGTLTDRGGGVYAVSDASFGQYGCAWGDNPATGVTIIDVCETITTGGSDQYGLVYEFVIISNDGTNLVINWSNNYGDAGRTTLTRTDGKEWPEGLSTN